MITISRPMTTPRLLDKWSFGEFHGANFRIDTVLTIVAPIIIFVVLDQFVTRSRLGKSIRAVSMSEENSKLMGININRVITLTFCIGGLTTGRRGIDTPRRRSRSGSVAWSAQASPRRFGCGWRPCTG